MDIKEIEETQEISATTEGASVCFWLQEIALQLAKWNQLAEQLINSIDRISL